MASASASSTPMELNETKKFILKNDYGSYEVDLRFLGNCEFFKNMCEDIDINIDEFDNSEPLCISNFEYYKDENEEVHTIDDPKDLLEEYINLFYTLNELKVEHSGSQMSWLNWYSEYNDEYIEEYTNKNADPPNCDELAKIGYDYTPSKLENILVIDTFFHNKLLITGIFGILTAMVRVGDRDDASELEKKYSEEIIESIMDITKKDMDAEWDEEQARKAKAKEVKEQIQSMEIEAAAPAPDA